MKRSLNIRINQFPRGQTLISPHLLNLIRNLLDKSSIMSHHNGIDRSRPYIIGKNSQISLLMREVKCNIRKHWDTNIDNWNSYKEILWLDQPLKRARSILPKDDLFLQLFIHEIWKSLRFTSFQISDIPLSNWSSIVYDIVLLNIYTLLMKLPCKQLKFRRINTLLVQNILYTLDSSC